MSQTYYTLLTKKGATLLASATALGVPLKLTHMAVGDGKGNITKPDANQTKLVREVRRAAINALFVDKNNANQIIAEQIIPESDGGWFIHEIGLFDDKGNLIAVGNCPATYKPKLAEGSGRTQVIRMIIIVDNTQSVELKIDPAVVLATRQYVDDLITATMTTHEKSTNHPSATTKSKGFVQLNSSIDSTLENQAATPLAVKKAYDTASEAVKKANDLMTTHEKSTNHPSATTKSKGFVQLNSSIDSTLENQAATPLAVKKAYDTASGAVKKTGDTMTGQLILPKDGLKINFDNKDIMALVTSNDNYSHVFYNSAKKQWLSKLIYNSTTNAWNFQYVDDVTINNKSVLKTGDAIQTFGDLSTILHLNDLTGSNEGVYYQGRNVSAVIERGYPINEAGTLQVFKNGADGAGCCQIYTTYRNARQFMRNYRGGTKTWEEWREVLGTGDYGIGSYIGAQLNNPDDTLQGGCYATRTTSFPELQTNRNDSASLIVYPAWTKNWYVEKLAVVQSKTPRIYYRCSTPDGKQPFYEALTTANASADMVGALPASKKLVNDQLTYEVGEQTTFKKRPTFSGAELITQNDYQNKTGYRRSPDGFLYQWGEIAIPTAGDNTQFNVVYPVAFNEGCYFLSAIYRFDAVFATEMQRTKTGFKGMLFERLIRNSIEAGHVVWFAIGR